MLTRREIGVKIALKRAYLIYDGPKGKNWYRFTGEAGTQMSENPPEYDHCGTYYSGWLNGSHPENEGEMEKKEICFSHPNKECPFRMKIRLLNCNNYYLYELENVRRCDAGYCAQ